MRLPLWAAIFFLLAGGPVYAALIGGFPLLAHSGSTLARGRELTAATSTVSTLATTIVEAMVRDLEGIDTGEAAAMVADMDVLKAAQVMEAMGTDKGAALMEIMPGDNASLIMEKMSTAKAVAMMGAMEVTRASQVEKVKAGAMMEGVSAGKAAEIVALVPEERSIPRLPEMSAAKLWELPLQLLMDKLPSVPIMHLDSWNKPPVPVDLPAARAMAVGQDVTEFLLPEARGGQWAEIAGDLPDVDRLWARFTRSLSDVRVKVERLDERPPRVASSAPSWPCLWRMPSPRTCPLRRPSSRWRRAGCWPTRSTSGPLSSAGSTRRRVPGCRRPPSASGGIVSGSSSPSSSPAISGSRGLGDQVFRVADLAVTPASPRAGSDFTVTANVTNTGSLPATYPAKLWLNSFVESAQDIVVEPDQTVPFSFTVNKPEGVYVVRVERLLDEFVVAPPSSLALPLTGGPSPSAWSLSLLAGLAAVMVFGGAALVRRSR